MLTLLRTLLGQPSARLVATTSIFDDNQVLMVREGSAHKRGEWNLPSGRVDRGEAVTAAAVREAREETGLDIQLVALAGIYIYQGGTGEDIVRFNFRAERTGGELEADGDEIIDLRWMTPSEILEMPDRTLRSASTLRTIVSDLLDGRSYPLELLRDGNLRMPTD